MVNGDPSSAANLVTQVYQELRKLAQHKMAHERPGQTLQATALVHEAWLRLSASGRQEWRDPEPFIRAAAEAMRRILVDNARRKLRLRHGGGLERVSLDCDALPITADDDKCLQVDEALNRLAAIHPRKAEILKLRVFTGLKFGEIAALLDCSEKTIQRDWLFAKAWMSRELSD